MNLSILFSVFGFVYNFIRKRFGFFIFGSIIRKIVRLNGKFRVFLVRRFIMGRGLCGSIWIYENIEVFKYRIIFRLWSNVFFRMNIGRVIFLDGAVDFIYFSVFFREVFVIAFYVRRLIFFFIIFYIGTFIVGIFFFVVVSRTIVDISNIFYSSILIYRL